MISINYFAIVVAAIAGVALGSVWFSPAFFGRTWAKLSPQGAGRERRSAVSVYFFEFLVMLLMAYVLGQLIAALAAYTLLSAIVLAFWLWLGFQAPIFFSGVWFERHPWKLFWIDALFRLVELIVMAIILALWV